MHSAIYHGKVYHHRFSPKTHRFAYPLFMAYLDLSELDTVFNGHWLLRWLCSTTRPAPVRFMRCKHLGDANTPLDIAVRDLVFSRTGHRPTGPIRLLTHLRYCGYGFNPVSFYYCFDALDTHVQHIVAEVNNTPWGEQHCYVLSPPNSDNDATQHTHHSVKAMHVSPFMPMALNYDWRFNQPADSLSVYMALRDNTAPYDTVFKAHLALKHRPMTGAGLVWTLARFPVMTAQVIVGIHWQALRLWLKRVPIHTHPNNLNT
jgi:uncharacterized protein